MKSIFSRLFKTNFNLKPEFQQHLFSILSEGLNFGNKDIQKTLNYIGNNAYFIGIKTTARSTHSIFSKFNELKRTKSLKNVTVEDFISNKDYSTNYYYITNGIIYSSGHKNFVLDNQVITFENAIVTNKFIALFSFDTIFLLHKDGDLNNISALEIYI